MAERHLDERSQSDGIAKMIIEAVNEKRKTLMIMLFYIGLIWRPDPL